MYSAMVLCTSFTCDDIIELSCLNDWSIDPHYQLDDKLDKVVYDLFISGASIVYLCCDERLLSCMNRCIEKNADKLFYIRGNSCDYEVRQSILDFVLHDTTKIDYITVID